MGDAMALVEESAAAAPEVSPWSARWIWAVAALLVVAASLAGWLWLHRAPAPLVVTRFQIDALPGTAFNYTYTGTAISPDGRAIVMRLASATDAPSLWIRPLDSLTARPLPGTESGDFPFWSPDSRTIGFFASGKLKRVDVSGGSPLVLCDASDADTGLTAGSWSRDGVILFGSPEGLHMVSASGGTSTLLAPVSPARRETGYGSPQFLPDGDRFLFFLRTDDPARQGWYAGAVSDPSRRTLVLATDRKAIFVPNESGDASFLLYTQDQTLLARRVNRTTFAFEGNPVPIAANVALFPPGFHASYWASSNGLLAYRTSASDKPRLTWAGRDQLRKSESGTEDFYTHVRLSPGGTHAAVELTDGTGNMDIWIWDFARHVKTRQTFDPKPDRYAVWSPDGREIAFSSFRTGTLQIYRKNIASGQPEVAITTGPSNKIVLDWSHDGRYLLFVDRGDTTAEDIWALPLTGNDRRPIALLRTPVIETQPALSPDGKWLAFETTASGRPEVFVEPFSPDSPGNARGRRWQISTDGGSRPRWSTDGRRLFFVALNDGAVLSAAVRASEAGLESDPPRVFAEVPLMPESRSPYDPTPDGQRVLLLERTVNQGTPLLIVMNWFAGLSR
jgi:Tol biopolymer transport system component